MIDTTRRKILTIPIMSMFISKFSFATSGFTNYFFNKNNSKNILVVYSSEYGSTKDIAKYIGKILSINGARVDVKYINNIKNIDKYKYVIVGSPIQYDTWRNDAKNFIKKHEVELSKLRVSYFFTCLTLAIKNNESKNQAQNYANNLEQLNAKIKPESIGQFAGVLDYHKFSFSFSIVARAMFSILGIKEGDYRDWNAIIEWSNKIK